MPNRRTQVLDAAVAVLGGQGVRQLTHRAVDAAADVPAGTTSNHFRTRDALIAAVIEHFAARERAEWETIAGRLRPGSPAALAEALAAFAVRATGPGRVGTLARYALFVEAAHRPELQARLGDTMTDLRHWSARWLAGAGSPAPDRDCRIVLDHLEGLMLHQVVDPDPRFNPAPQLTALLAALLPG